MDILGLTSQNIVLDKRLQSMPECNGKNKTSRGNYANISL